ncbi:uncharacterized protein SCDLUD_001054 [Saccharomycodes ludwigii]|uniref:uncharacterized protein n=1 Tax=Saccharomycodes ludwigii TaxID=36035 RepID=UPI001E82B31F|nr:hypothetical protein SCDLUD_001054 [Saccharomycodes ludwigii]KAH3903417.1 hypothetical protein SCDLUD_001054 [Saccharomycodes ludwigii]
MIVLGKVAGKRIKHFYFCIFYFFFQFLCTCLKRIAYFFFFRSSFFHARFGLVKLRFMIFLIYLRNVNLDSPFFAFFNVVGLLHPLSPLNPSWFEVSFGKKKLEIRHNVLDYWRERDAYYHFYHFFFLFLFHPHQTYTGNTHRKAKEGGKQ